MKRIISAVFTIVLLAVSGFLANVSAADNVKIYINGKQLKSDKAAYIENGRTMVPARSIFEELGATVKWGIFDDSITADTENFHVVMHIGSNVLSVNGEEKIMDTSPVITDSSTYVPARAVAQSFGAKVEWLPEINTVNITTGKETLEGYPAVLLPDFNGINTVCTNSEKGYAVYSLTVDEPETSQLASEIINLVVNYEAALSDIGWYKEIYANEATLLEAEFSQNSMSDCNYGFKYFIRRPERGKYEFYIGTIEYIHVFNIKNGEIRCIPESDYLLNAEYRDTSVWRKSAGKEVTLYDSYNNAVTVSDYEVYRYLENGYSENMKTVTMYSKDNEEINVGIHMVEAFMTLGYYTEPVTMMYSPDGDAEYVGRSKVYEKTLTGWSTEPFYVTLYSHNGKTIKVKLHEKDSYIAEGWYTELLVAMYYPNGRKIYVPESQAWFYTECGCTRELVITDITSKDEPYATVYITPSGRKYHHRSSCAGANAIAVTLRETEGIYEPCSICAK